MSLFRPTSWNIATMPAPSNPIWGEKFLMKKEKGEDDADDDENNFFISLRGFHIQRAKEC